MDHNTRLHLQDVHVVQYVLGNVHVVTVLYSMTSFINAVNFTVYIFQPKNASGMCEWGGGGVLEV